MDGRGIGEDRFARCRHDSWGMRGPRGVPGSRGMHGRGSLPEGGPRSVARGGIKFAILGLVKDKPRHGYDIIREMEESSGGLYSPSPGAVYPTLQALEDQDLVSSTTEEGKKVYAITEAGVAYLEEHKERADSHRERWESHWGRGLEGEPLQAVGEIREALGEVKGAVRDSAGDPVKLKEMGAVLREAAAKIGDIAMR
jgi:DNA-binding PadR family transcriptional regulator